MEKATKFVKLWLDNETDEYIAQECNLTVKSVPSYAHELHKKGINLPYRYDIKAIRVSELNEIIRKAGYSG